MSDFRSPLRKPWTPAPDSAEYRIMEFMRKNGHTGYDNEIREITDEYVLIQAEAGEAHGFCQFTQATLDSIDRRVKEIVQEAVDRYDDWASDALP